MQMDKINKHNTNIKKINPYSNIPFIGEELQDQLIFQSKEAIENTLFEFYLIDFRNILKCPYTQYIEKSALKSVIILILVWNNNPEN